MSALGQKRTSDQLDVRFTPKSGHWLSASACPLLKAAFASVMENDACSKTSTSTGKRMQTEQITWHYDGTTIELGVDWSGQGPLVLLLPAPSSISTRREMRPLQGRLSTNFQTVSIDWPGFGSRPRPRHDGRPEIYSDFLGYLIGTILPPVHAVIAAGHAATFALLHACTNPGIFKRLVLIAPTWRGPLPTMMDGQRPLFDRICRLVDLPIIGPLLYRLNVNRRDAGRAFSYQNRLGHDTDG